MTYQNYSLEQLQLLDGAHHLHPFTDHKDLRAAGSRIIARAEAVRKEVLTQSLIEGVNEFSSNLAESEAEAEQPSANFVASAYRTTERQAAELLAHA